MLFASIHRIIKCTSCIRLVSICNDMNIKKNACVAGSDVPWKGTHTPSLGLIFNGHIKSPEKQNTKINITVRSQPTTISQLQYHLQYNLHSRYKISIIHPSCIHP